MWDDDTVPRSDSPFSPYPPKIKSHLPYTRLRDTGKIVMATDYAKRSGMCGNREEKNEFIPVLVDTYTFICKKALLF